MKGNVTTCGIDECGRPYVEVDRPPVQDVVGGHGTLADFLGVLVAHTLHADPKCRRHHAIMLDGSAAGRLHAEQMQGALWVPAMKPRGTGRCPFRCSLTRWMRCSGGCGCR